MATMSGKDGAITINGTAKCIKKWSLDASCKMVDVTGSCNSGAEAVVPGITSCTVDITVVYDDASEPWPVLTPGTALTNVILKMDSDSAMGTIANAYVEKVGVATVIDGEITVDATIRATGLAMSTLFA